MHFLIRNLAAAFVLFSAASCAHRSSTSESWLPASPPLPKSDASGLAPVNGIKIFYQVFNASGGNPVLLLHGAMVSGDISGYQVPVLMKTHRVIVVDCRGHGRSTRDERPFTIPLMAEDTLALLNYLKEPKVAIVGVSLGGGIALEMAMQHPERVSRIFAQGGVGYTQATAKPFDYESAATKAFMQWVANEYARLSPTPDRFAEFSAAANAMPDWNPTAAQLGRISVPVCVAQSENDEFIYNARAEEAARLIPGAQFLLLRGVGHMVTFQQPDVFNRAMLAFLNGK